MIINIVTIFLGLSVGSKLSADQFLSIQTLGIVLKFGVFCIECIYLMLIYPV